MKAFVAAFLLAAAAGTASAQTTNCSPDGIGGMSCNTTPSVGQSFANLGNAIAAQKQKKMAAALFVQAVNEGRCDEANALAMQYGNKRDLALVRDQCVDHATVVAQRESNLTALVSTAVREGRCDEAKELALNANRLDMADQALRVCTPAKP